MKTIHTCSATRLPFSVVAVAILVIMAACSQSEGPPAAAGTDPLTSRNDGPNKVAMIEFVSMTENWRTIYPDET